MLELPVSIKRVSAKLLVVSHKFKTAVGSILTFRRGTSDSNLSGVGHNGIVDPYGNDVAFRSSDIIDQRFCSCAIDLCKVFGSVQRVHMVSKL